MFRKVSLACVFFAVLTSCQGSCNNTLNYGVSKDDKNIIEKEHNNVRKQIADGELDGQPRGKNFKTIKFDEALAQKAQEIANTCDFSHVTVTDERWQAVGQNLYLSISTSSSADPNWKSAVQAWINEYKQYAYGLGQYNHYTQVVWADTEFVGCGFTAFDQTSGKFRYKKIYVCNYGPAGNWVGENPYPLA